MDITSIILNFLASILIFILAFISIFILRIYTGKSIRDPKYPPVLGTVYHQALHLKRLHDYHTEVALKHSTYRLLAPNQSEIYTTDPRNIEHILKTNFHKYDKGEYHRSVLRDLFGNGIFAVDGDKWKQQRKLASHEFSTRVLRDFSCVVFRRNALKLVGVVALFSKPKQAFDIHDMLMRYALDSIFKVGFGVELNCINGSSSEDGAKFIKAFDDANELVFWRFMDPIWKLKRVLNIGSEAVLKRNLETMDKFVHRLIKQKSELLQEKQLHTMEKEDILSRFLEARKKEPETMTDEYLRDIILNFMIAGKDTTANALSWFIYAVCENPIVQENIVQEVTKYVFSSSDLNDTRFDLETFVDNLTDETLDKMHYLHASLTETLRLYPGVPVDGRAAMEDDVLPDGYKVRKGDDVHYLAYAMGRMQSIWGDDALEFRPERWLQNGVFQPESPYKFVAFHGGPRVCLGKDFAYRQMKIVAVALLYLFRFKLADERKKVTYRMMLTLHIHGGFRVNAIPRFNPDYLNL